MANRKKKPAPKWSPSELLYAVTGWLTTRKQPIVFGDHYTADAIAQLLGEVLKLNKIPAPGDHYPKIKVPGNLDHLTNNQPVGGSVMKRMTTGEAYDAIRGLFRGFEHDDQDAILAQVLIDLKRSRDLRLKHAQSSVQEYEQHHEKLQQSAWNLDNVIRGNFAVLKPLFYEPQADAKQATNGDNNLKKSNR